MSRNPSASVTTITTVQAQIAAASQMIAAGATTSRKRNAGTLNLGGSVSNYGLPPAGAVASILAEHNTQTNTFLQRFLTSDVASSSNQMSFKEAFEEYIDLKHRLQEVGEQTDVGQCLKRRCVFLETVMDDTERSGHTFSHPSQSSASMQQQPATSTNANETRTAQHSVAADTNTEQQSESTD